MRMPLNRTTWVRTAGSRRLQFRAAALATARTAARNSMQLTQLLSAAAAGSCACDCVPFGPVTADAAGSVP